MQNSLLRKPYKGVAIWLLIGVCMIIIQILLGGITRLTESGLSITEWKPLTGVLPPLNPVEWQMEFDKYKHTDQFRFIHSDFTMADFKHIFFWEWFHRLWARILGVVFLFGFFYFLVKKQFQKTMIIPMMILFLLGAMQGIVGWIMVKSGLVPEKLFVGHIQLATHFIAALFLLCYTFWFALSLLISPGLIIYSKPLRKTGWCLLILLSIQLVFGAFMAGLKAATAAPTWPDINGSIIPESINRLHPWWINLLDNKITVQFIHRDIAYLLTLLVLVWTMQALRTRNNILLNRTKWVPLLLIITQVILGICTVLRSPYGNELVFFGVAHQLVAIIFLLSTIWILFIVKGPAPH